MLLEVIATHVTDAKIAEESGADRIELITGILEGGLTPSYGLIEQVVNAVQIPVNVMVHPHSASFCYNSDDLKTMQKDIQMIKKLGANGIVLGVLTPDQKINVEALQFLLSEADGLDVTFHRAFDEVPDQEEAFHTLLQFPQIKTILTSGGQSNVLHAVDQMKQLVQWTENTHIQILAGSGLTIAALPDFLKATNVQEIHFGKGVRRNEQALEPIDGDKVRAIKRLF
ncbi:copper homeostasis protein CutC [Thermoflavimicrobium daqui]|jgi:copper homeostasis protein|uniref:PF03932 family protein CutC n=1 Tax=Thermoflavimicrobium daqui TaxID=2137476 RepID=A0A364K0N0_9BACL|nr:copper homeostasis protein CutC [Thermoflavimicrobium daqui]RAL21061.1 copper homeostasis protein [Thermoflavimicrobium daqui]